MPNILGQNSGIVNRFSRNDFKKLQSFTFAYHNGLQMLFAYINYKRVRARNARILHKKVMYLAMCKHLQNMLCVLL